MKKTVLVLLLAGLGFAGTTVQAKDWTNVSFAEVQKAAVQGDASAQLNLALMYDSGLGAVQDYSQAIAWYSKAAGQGVAEAKYLLGSIYYAGKGVAQDYRQATVWYRMAADQGYETAQLKLGLMYYQGQGVAQNYSQAMSWYRKSAEHGLAEAQYLLGLMYADGVGVTQDYKLAYVWFSVAAANGDTDAPAKRNKYAKIVTSEELVDAKTLASQYFEQYQPKKLYQFSPCTQVQTSGYPFRPALDQTEC